MIEVMYMMLIALLIANIYIISKIQSWEKKIKIKFETKTKTEIKIISPKKNIPPGQREVKGNFQHKGFLFKNLSKNQKEKVLLDKT